MPSRSLLCGPLRLQPHSPDSGPHTGPRLHGRPHPGPPGRGRRGTDDLPEDVLSESRQKAREMVERGERPLSRVAAVIVVLWLALTVLGADFVAVFGLLIGGWVNRKTAPVFL